MGRRKTEGAASGSGVAVIGTRHDEERSGERVTALPRFQPDDWPGEDLQAQALAYARAAAPSVGERSPGVIAWAAVQSWERFERTGSDKVYLGRRRMSRVDPSTDPRKATIIARLQGLSA